MAGLLSASTVESFTGQFYKHFQTYCEPIVIYKEPVKIISQTTTDSAFPGFPIESNDTNVTYSAQSGIFSGIMIYPGTVGGNDQSSILQGKILLDTNSTYVKVRQDCRDYIENGVKNESIEVNGYIYNIGSKHKVQNFVGSKYYYFQLEETQ